MSTIAKNIRVLRDLKKISQEQLAEQLKINRSRLGAYEEGRNEPPIEIIINIATYFQISIDALLRGNLSKTNPEALMKIGNNRILFPILVDAENNDLIEVIPIKATAGYVTGYADPEFIQELPTMKLPFKLTGKHRAFPIKGDSMPPVKEGAYIVAKYVESVEDIKSGETYVLITKNDGLVYKRVKNNIKKGGELELHSDNKVYQPYNIPASDVLELWEYTCCIDPNKYKEEELNPESIMRMLKGLQVEIQSIKKSN
jgi:transcriptional regulator with XRE-family HTH domain